MKYKVVSKEGLKLTYKFFRFGSEIDSDKVAATVQELEMYVENGVLELVSEGNTPPNTANTDNTDKAKGGK